MSKTDQKNDYYAQSDAGQIEKYTTQAETPYQMYQDRNNVDVNLSGLHANENNTDNSNTNT